MDHTIYMAKIILTYQTLIQVTILQRSMSIPPVVLVSKAQSPILLSLPPFASTSSVSTSKSKVEVESNVREHIQKPIVVQDLPSFTCNKSDKNKYNSRTSCNKNGCFNQKASNVKKKSCFVCGSRFHLIKDFDYHEKRMGVSYGQQTFRPTWTNVPPFVPRATHVKTSRPNPTDKPVSAGRSFPAHWKRHVARPFYIPTSTYFQNGFWHGCYNPMYMGGTRWDTGVKPSTGCSWTNKRKGSFWVPKNNSLSKMQ